MTSYEISLNFQELTPIYNDDYEISDDGGWNVPIGKGTGPLAPGATQLPAQIGY